MLKYRGQLTIVLMIIIAVAAAAWAWWMNFESTKESMRYFGSTHAARIHRASSVQILSLAPYKIEAPNVRQTKTVEIDGIKHQVSETWEAGASPGMSHLRHAILHDDSYSDFTIPTEPAEVEWAYCLVFAENDQTTKVAISIREARLTLLPDGDTLSIVPALEGIAEVIHASRDR